MPKLMNMDALLDPRLAAQALHQMTDVGGIERPAVERADQRRGAGEGQLRPSRHPLLDDRCRACVHADTAQFVALAVADRDERAVVVNVLREQVERLLAAKPRPPREHKQRAVADARRSASRALRQQHLNLNRAQQIRVETLTHSTGTPSARSSLSSG